ncbi:MAG: helix-turn-helix transcriptional regulator [Candidatus Latescibacteria bacterium]|nr:helix-turn-helix transcriptional regulator [Candidatus Latescibacterota bacterium]
MLKFQLHILMAERGPDRPYRISEIAGMTGLQANTVSAIFNNRAKRIDLATIETLCQALDCTPGELFQFKPEPDATD